MVTRFTADESSHLAEYRRFRDKLLILEHAWNDFQNGVDVPNDMVKPEVLASWCRLTILNILIALAALIGSWAVGAWIPTIVNLILTKQGLATAEVVKHVSIVSMVYNLGGLIGYCSWGFIADRIGRKPAFIMCFVGASVVAPVLFFGHQSYAAYLYISPFLGYFVFAAFGGLAIYMAEVYPTHMRATGSSFCLNISRYLVALAPLWTGVLVKALGGLTIAAAAFSIMFVIGLVASFFLRETKGLKLA